MAELIIVRKFWLTFRAQFNKLANFFWTRDPIAQMQLEYDQSVAQLKEGREGLEQYRALVERVTRQVKADEKKIETLTAKIKAYLAAGDRNTAGQLAIELERAKQEMAENREQLSMHETAYGNNLEKIKHAAKNLNKVQEKIKKYEAELKMSQAEAEMAKLSQSFEFDVTTDFGELEQVVQDKIDRNRAASRVAADLSGRGVEDIKAEQAMEKALADDLLSRFEVEMGMKTPETAEISPQTAPLGPEKATVEMGGDKKK
ncbi:MAG: PspA/IM30 family protein [Thermodesulfobacteriota bacterium]